MEDSSILQGGKGVNKTSSTQQSTNSAGHSRGASVAVERMDVMQLIRRKLKFLMERNSFREFYSLNRCFKLFRNKVKMIKNEREEFLKQLLKIRQEDKARRAILKIVLNKNILINEKHLVKFFNKFRIITRTLVKQEKEEQMVKKIEEELVKNQEMLDKLEAAQLEEQERELAREQKSEVNQSETHHEEEKNKTNQEQPNMSRHQILILDSNVDSFCIEKEKLEKIFGASYLILHPNVDNFSLESQQKEKRGDQEEQKEQQDVTPLKEPTILMLHPNVDSFSIERIEKQPGSNLINLVLHPNVDNFSIERINRNSQLPKFESGSLENKNTENFSLEKTEKLFNLNNLKLNLAENVNYFTILKIENSRPSIDNMSLLPNLDPNEVNNSEKSTTNFTPAFYTINSLENFSLEGVERRYQPTLTESQLAPEDLEDIPVEIKLSSSSSVPTVKKTIITKKVSLVKTKINIREKIRTEVQKTVRLVNIMNRTNFKLLKKYFSKLH